MEKRWKRLTKILSGDNQEVPQGSQLFADIQTLRSKFIQSWKDFRTDHYPANLVLQIRDLGIVLTFWRKLENFCDLGWRTASNAFSYLETNDPAYLNLDTELLFEAKWQDTKLLIKTLIRNVSENVFSAIANEQKGNFPEARSDYRKANKVIKESKKSFPLDQRDILTKPMASYLKDLDDNWESWHKLTTSTPPNSIFGFKFVNDILANFQMETYHDLVRIKKQLPGEKNMAGLLDDWKDLNELVLNITRNAKLAARQLANEEVLESLEQHSEPFQPWYVPEEERLISYDASLAFDFLAQINEITKYILRSPQTTDVFDRCVYAFFVENRKKYSTLKSLKKSVFGSSVSPQMLQSEKIEFVDDAYTVSNIYNIYVDKVHIVENANNVNNIHNVENGGKADSDENSAFQKSLKIFANVLAGERGL